MVIFTSTEMFESQHRVKIFSFFLLFICTMNLLSLLSLMLAGGANNDPLSDDYIPPGNPTDSPMNTGAAGLDELRSWQNTDYLDLGISTFGFYVSTLGIRAATENSLFSAKKYLYGLILVGTAYLSFDYYTYVLRLDEGSQNDDDSNDIIGDADDDINQNDNKEDLNGFSENVYFQAFVSVSLPLCIWGICFLRAFQFQQLVRQAEMEAMERHGRITRELERGTSGALSDNPNTNASSDEIGITFGSVDNEIRSSTVSSTSNRSLL